MKDQVPWQSTPGKKVISMNLYGDNPKYTLGAIRNAQLTPVFFPGWTLRVYTGKDQQNVTVPTRILDALQRLGTEIVVIDASI